MTLYLKYRPDNLDELDSTDAASNLKKILSSKKIPHAFLFAGPKGTGKTSAARILAKVINCENLKDAKPCDRCEQCVSITKGTNLDVIEMDAASHRGIDDVRTLRDAVKLSPVKAKKKIYIIDEAHMLTTEASNALLKTLEEPPEHVIFILATTNPEKLIETIRSRVTLIPFRKATEKEIVRSLKRVAGGEKIKITDEALNVIAKSADGSFRDGIKILEQLVAEEKELTYEFLEEYLFRNKSFDTDHFIELLAAKDTKNLIIEIGKLGPSGVSTEVFLESLLGKLRLALLGKVGIGEDIVKSLSREDLILLVDLFSQASVEVSDSLIEELPLEMAVIKWGGEKKGSESQTAHTKQNSDPDLAGVSGKTKLVEPENSDQDIKSSETNSDPQTIASGVRSHEIPSPENNNTHMQTAAPMEEGGVNDDAWKMILSLIKPINASIEALLRAARPMTYNGKVLTLGVYYKFHKERLEDARHRKILEEIVAQVLQSPTKVVCTLVEPPPKQIIQEAKVETVLTEGEDKDIIKAAEEIFGN